MTTVISMQSWSEDGVLKARVKGFKYILINDKLIKNFFTKITVDPFEIKKYREQLKSNERF